MDAKGEAVVDPITQGALGAVTAQSFSSRKWMKHALLAGTLGGMAADLDVLIRSSSDPLLALEYHRHFTHSFIFIPFGGALVGFLLSLLLRSWSRRKLILFSVIGYATHALLDACTSYGTQLFWPFSNTRIAWHNVGIIDPIPTLAWICGSVFAYRTGRKRLAHIGLAIGILYLVFGVVQRERAADVQKELLALRGHQSVRREVKPTVLQLLVWRSTYEFEGRFYSDAIYVGLTPRWYEGASVQKFDRMRDLPELQDDSVLADDIDRFIWFSDGWVGLHPRIEMDGKIVLGDIRYALLPQEIDPLWGIVFDPRTSDRHSEYETFRSPSSEKWGEFRALMMGSEIFAETKRL